MTDLRHKGWHIYPNDFVAHPDAWKVAWCAAHDDFDGAEDANDHRCLCAATVEEVRAEIDEWELTHPEQVYDRTWTECPSCLGEGSVLVGPLNGEEKLDFCSQCGGYGGWFGDEEEASLGNSRT